MDGLMSTWLAIALIVGCAEDEAIALDGPEDRQEVAQESVGLSDHTAPDAKTKAPAAAGPIEVELEELECPEGSEAKNGRSERGVEQWCDLSGVMHGEYVRFHLTGTVAVRGNYKVNEAHGKWEWFHKTSQIESKGRYKEGKKVGSWAWWHENGERAQEGDYRDALRSGLWTTWYTNGRKSEEGTYRNGQRDGRWYFYNRNGTLQRVEEWEYGKKGAVTGG
jgi:hypothetical protein